MRSSGTVGVAESVEIKGSGTAGPVMHAFIMLIALVTGAEGCRRNG